MLRMGQISLNQLFFYIKKFKINDLIIQKKLFIKNLEGDIRYSLASIKKLE